MQRPFNKIEKPQREPRLFQHVMDPFMIDGIECLGRVEKEKNSTIVLDNSLIKQLIEGDYVFGTILACQKPLWEGSTRASTAGMIPRATTAVRVRLSVLVTLSGLVSARRPVSFLGRR